MKNYVFVIIAMISVTLLTSCYNTSIDKKNTAASTPQTSILFKNTLRYNKVQLKEFKASLEEGVAFAKANAPQLFVHVYLDEQNGLAYSYQFFRNSQDILEHWKVSEKQVNNVMEYSEVIKFEVFGSPSTEVVKGINQVLDPKILFYYKEFCGYDNIDKN